MATFTTVFQAVKKYVRRTDVVDHASDRKWVGTFIELGAYGALGAEILFDVLNMGATLPLLVALAARLFVLFTMKLIDSGVSTQKDRRFTALNPVNRTRLAVEVTILLLQFAFETILVIVFGVGSFGFWPLVAPVLLLIAAGLYAYEGLR